MLTRYILPLLILISAGYGFYLLNNKDTLPTANSSATSAPASAQSGGGVGQRPGGTRNPAGATQTPDGGNAATQASTETPQSDGAPNQRKRGAKGMAGGGFGGNFGATTAPTVSLQVITASSWQPEVNLFGSVMAFRSLDVTSPITATLLTLSVGVGDAVTAGQLLATLDQTDVKNTQRQSLSRLTEMDAKIRLQELQQQSDQQSMDIEKQLLTISQASLDRIAGLAKQNLASNTDYENALKSHQNQVMSVQNRAMALARFDDTMAQLQAQRTDLLNTLDTIKQQLADTRIEAPFSGIVSDVMVQTGQRVNSNGVILALFDDTNMGLETRIPVKWLDQFTGKNIAAVVTKNPKTTLTLDTLGKQATQGSVQAWYRFNSKTAIPLGQHLAITTFLPALTSVYAVPAKMLYENRMVFTVIEGRLLEIPVTVEGQVIRDGATLYLISSPELTDKQPLLNTRLANASSGLRVELSSPPIGDSAARVNKP